jgi:hypothetical protein
MELLMFEEVTISHILGPLGGTIALSWAAGATSGYIFAVKLMTSKINFLEEQIALNDRRCDARLKANTELLQDQINLIKDILKSEIDERHNKEKINALLKDV